MMDLKDINMVDKLFSKADFSKESNFKDELKKEIFENKISFIRRLDDEELELVSAAKKEEKFFEKFEKKPLLFPKK